MKGLWPQRPRDGHPGHTEDIPMGTPEKAATAKDVPLWAPRAHREEKSREENEALSKCSDAGANQEGFAHVGVPKGA